MTTSLFRLAAIPLSVALSACVGNEALSTPSRRGREVRAANPR